MHCAVTDPPLSDVTLSINVIIVFFWSSRVHGNLAFFFFFYCLLSRSISDHYLRSCGNVTCSRPQRKAPRLRIEPRTSGTGVNHSTPAPVRSTRVHRPLTLKSTGKMKGPKCPINPFSESLRPAIQ